MSGSVVSADLAQDLRDSVADYRNPATPETDRSAIREYWRGMGIPNQFAAMLRAANG